MGFGFHFNIRPPPIHLDPPHMDIPAVNIKPPRIAPPRIRVPTVPKVTITPPRIPEIPKPVFHNSIKFSMPPTNSVTRGITNIARNAERIRNEAVKNVSPIVRNIEQTVEEDVNTARNAIIEAEQRVGGAISGAASTATNMLHSLAPTPGKMIITIAIVGFLGYQAYRQAAKTTPRVMKSVEKVTDVEVSALAAALKKIP